MKEDYKTIIKQLDRMSYYGMQAILSDSLKFQNGMIPLAELNSKILTMSSIRNEILKKFYQDIKNELKKRKEVTISVSLDPRKLMVDDYLNLNINIGSDKINCLLSKDRVINSSCYIPDLDMATSIIYPYVEGLFRLLDLEDTKNLLSNSFYQDLYVNIDCLLKRLVINGNGVNVSLEDLDKLSLSTREKLEILSYYYENIKEILSKVLVFNDDILNRYKTEVTKRQALSIYRGGK